MSSVHLICGRPTFLLCSDGFQLYDAFSLSIIHYSNYMSRPVPSHFANTMYDVGYFGSSYFRVCVGLLGVIFSKGLSIVRCVTFSPWCCFVKGPKTLFHKYKYWMCWSKVLALIVFGWTYHFLLTFVWDYPFFVILLPGPRYPLFRVARSSLENLSRPPIISIPGYVTCPIHLVVVCSNISMTPVLIRISLLGIPSRRATPSIDPSMAPTIGYINRNLVTLELLGSRLK